MRCSNCGFISNSDFDECPYCGCLSNYKRKFLNKRISLSNNSSVKLTTLIAIIFVNLFIAVLIIDIFYSFQYFLTLGAYIILVLIGVIFRISSKKRGAVMIVENLDFYFISSLILVTTLLPVYYRNNLAFANLWKSSSFLTHTNPGPFFAFLVIPTFLLLVSPLIITLLITSRKEKFRPLVTGSILNFHFLLSLTLFILLMVAKGDQNVANYVIIYQNKLNDWLTVFEEAVISLSFIINTLIFINFNTMVVVSIINHSRIVYGKNEKD
ncbi:MAG: zinc ribbon domain-containing protein [Bacilli bacterium]|nr:zinc ribbon domain-containing protein [Bacilli bacterium]